MDHIGRGVGALLLENETQYQKLEGTETSGKALSNKIRDMLYTLFLD